MAELVIFVGLPGAGKSTHFARYFAATHRLVSKDLWPNGRNKEARQRRLVTDALAEGDSVVVDNTNVRAEDRVPLIDLAKSFGARVRGVWFVAPLEACLARNAQRTGRACVPENVLRGFARRLEPPSYDEGFDELATVLLTESLELVVTSSARHDVR